MSTDPKIVHNAAQCKLCGDIIESVHRHDYVRCQCGEIFVDGGREYRRAGARNLENFISLSFTQEDMQ